MRICTLSVGLALLGAALLAAPSWAESGAAFTWGRNIDGELGNGTSSTLDGIPAVVPGLGEVTALDGGHAFTLALMPDGTVMAWGSNQDGQLGNPAVVGNSDVPVPVPGLSDVVAIAAGEEFALALRADGTVEAWGAGFHGQLGDGSTEKSAVPIAVPGLSGVASIAAGPSSGYAVLSDGTVRSWGGNGFGQLGDGTTEDRDVPVTVAGLSEVVQVAGGFFSATARLLDGQAESWGGSVDRGYEVHEIFGSESHLARTIPGLSDVTELAMGWNLTLALLGDGSVRVWGSNERGALGKGETDPDIEAQTPQPLPGLVGITAIAAKRAHALALLQDGTVMAWGDSEFGEDGDGNHGPYAYRVTPTPIICGLNHVAGVAAGAVTSLAWGTVPPQPCPTITAWPVPQEVPANRTTAVTITGTEFIGSTLVTIGGEAVSFTVDSNTEITALAPPGPEGSALVQVTTPGGTSIQGFWIRRRPLVEPPEFGRCIDGHVVGEPFACFKGHWYPAVEGPAPLVKAGMTLSAGAMTVETAAKTSLVCTAASGEGAYTGIKTVSLGSLTLTGCHEGSGTQCQSGTGQGVIATNALVGEPGITKIGSTAKTDKTGLLIHAASGETIADFTCGATTVQLAGSLIVELKANEALVEQTLKAKGKNGVLKPAGFAGGPAASLRLKFGAAAAETSGFAGSIIATSEEAVELNTEI